MKLEKTSALHDSIGCPSVVSRFRHSESDGVSCQCFAYGKDAEGHSLLTRAYGSTKYSRYNTLRRLLHRFVALLIGSSPVPYLNRVYDRFWGWASAC
jgi:hypothetical protein